MRSCPTPYVVRSVEATTSIAYRLDHSQRLCNTNPNLGRKFYLDSDEQKT